MKKIIMSLLIIFILPIPANAYVYGSTQYPSTVYVAPDPYYQVGQAVGNLLSALIAKNEAAKAEKELQENVAKANENIQAITDRELESMIAATNNVGIQGTIAMLQDITFKQGINLNINNYNDIIDLSFKVTNPNFTTNYLYTYRTSTNECRVIVEVPEANITKVAYGKYSEPKPQVTLAESVGQYLGIVTSTQKTPEGGFAILEVIPNGLSDFAGVKKGDILTKIDTYDLKEHDIDRVVAYIALRQEQKQIIRATVLRENKPLVVQIQL